MEFQQLKTFVTITHVGSFTKAAEILDYAQSSISGQIRALENELGVRLFERLGREVTLTEEGKRLLGYADPLLKMAEEAKEAVTGKTCPTGTLIIGAPESLSTFRLPPLLQEYRRNYPNVKLVLKLGSCRSIYKWLKKGIIDIAFILDQPINSPGLSVETLTYEPISLIASTSHPLARREACNPSDLAGEDLILTDECSCSYRSHFEAQMAEAGIQPGTTQEFGSVETIKRCVMSGLGISILPTIAVEHEIAHGQLCNLHWINSDFNLYTLMAYKKGKWISPALSALMQKAREMYCQ